MCFGCHFHRRRSDRFREVINLSDDSESDKKYVPVGLGEELELFGRRSMWRMIGPGTVRNNIFTFLATNQSLNEDEFYLSLGWQQFREVEDSLRGVNQGMQILFSN
ncbi:hypothetical protein PIB30_059038 [Stylosanthes scabra]|uniref:Uncharacterized protein n=1 Tax=Stylosanthes scabra TaxID=79078 RepID=A0ABU6UJN3_9FABA|nr:hypothetical protein [Stylosanthes scabra]